MDQLLYGVAYYDEYMPYDRLSEDIRMMKEAGINTVRIAESTWSTHEPQNGVFDFSSVSRVLDAMYEANIHVIVGTPTYAIPTWMVKEHPEVMAVTSEGRQKYGARQIMDITHPVYLYYSERIIRKLMEHVHKHPAVIGYQADNETKHYGTAGENVQLNFVKYMKETYKTVEEINQRFGLSYWSNRINSWEDFPSMLGTINGSLGAEFAKFQRGLVTDFLAWQVSIINEYKLPHQFVTQNFDFEWRGHSFGVQPSVDHFAASEAFDIVGVDIYHPSQSQLTGAEISFGGDIARSLKQTNYLVLETQAQAFSMWTPYPGQLRLLAFSHLGSGASMVAYWHWHSIHNSFETYWKGLLSHDFLPNPVYEEAKTIGADFKRLSEVLIGLKKNNKVAIMVSNESLSAIDWFKLPNDKNYNDVVRWMYDELYKLNIECDFVHPSSSNLNEYKLIVVPALYSAGDDQLENLNEYVHQGGNVIYSFKSGFTNQQVQVRYSQQPGVIHKACGVSYSLFITPEERTGLKGVLFPSGEGEQAVENWMELLVPDGAEVLAYYDHPEWGNYAAVTRNRFGSGTATYIGCMTTASALSSILKDALKDAGLWEEEQSVSFPTIMKSGVSRDGRNLRYYYNYSEQPCTVVNRYGRGLELLSGCTVIAEEQMIIEPWGVKIIIEENE